MISQTTKFVRLPLALVQLLPDNRTQWEAGLLHGLDIANRLPPESLPSSDKFHSENLITVRVPCSKTITTLSQTLSSKTGWKFRRCLLVALEIALNDRFSPLYKFSRRAPSPLPTLLKKASGE